MPERDLKEYIILLNDRNLQRQSSKGFTLFAILGALFFCLNYLLMELNVLIDILFDTRILDVAVITSNFFVTFFYFYVFYLSSVTSIPKTRVYPNQNPLKLDLDHIPFYLIVMIIGILNMMLVFKPNSNLGKAMPIIFSLITILNLLSPLLLLLYSYLKRKNKNMKGLSTELIDFTKLNKKDKGSMKIGLVLYWVFLTAIWFLLILLSDVNLDTEKLIPVIKYVVILIGAFILLEFAMELKAKQQYYIDLEELERDIFFENLSNREIADIYENDFDGVPFKKWILNKEHEISEFFKLRKREIREIESIINLNLNDELGPQIIKIQEQNQQIIKLQKSIVSNTNDFVQLNITTFNNLIKYSSLDENEHRKLRIVKNYLAKKVEKLNSKYSKVLNDLDYINQITSPNTT